MKYLVKAMPIPSKRDALLKAVTDKSLGVGSVAFGEYIKNMKQARELDDGTICWVEVCFCATPLQEERPYWEEYFSDIDIEQAVKLTECRDSTGEEAYACLLCGYTQELEDELLGWGKAFLT